MISKKPTVVFDIGGTNTRVGVSWNGTTLKRYSVYKTPLSYGYGLQELVTAARNLAGKHKIQAAVGGIAGPLNMEKTMVVDAPSLTDWNNKPLTHDLSKALHAPAYLENDTELVGLGEAVYGAGKDHAIVMYMTVSTGVNAVRIVNGKLDVHRYPIEAGRQIIDASHAMESKGRGDVEDFIAGRSIAKRFGVPPRELENKKAWENITYYLSVAVHNSVLHWSPDIVVLGGGVMKHITLSQVRKNTYDLLSGVYPYRPIIVRGVLKDVGGLMGALAYNTLTR